MKVGIVTVYNSQNCGSFLQAISLFKCLENLGYDVGFTKSKLPIKLRLIYRILMASKYILKGQIKKGVNIFKTAVRFRIARKDFRYLKLSNKIDTCIYGSDTIWNINSKNLLLQWKHYFGEEFKGYKIAYAPSIGDTPIESVLAKEELCNCIKKFSALSVRDESTYNLVSQIISNKEITYVVDPTMLMPKSFYEEIASGCNEENFILFYAFQAPDKKIMEQIREYADKNGKKIICFGENVPMGDKYLCFNPLDMMAYFSKADLIITDTFHGNVFSIIFNKDFVNIDRQKAKVDDLLKRFELTERTVQGVADFDKIVSDKIDFNKVNEKLEEFRKTSCDYLIESLNKVKEKIE